MGTRLHYDVGSHGILPEVVILTVQNNRNGMIGVQLPQELCTKNGSIERILPTIGPVLRESLIIPCIVSGGSLI